MNSDYDSEPMDRKSVSGMLQAQDIQPTQQRVEIAQILFSRPQHLSADQVLTQVNKERNTVSKATVYNTLGLLASKGLIREVFVDPNRVFYDSNINPHHHFYNLDNGELMDIPTDALNLCGAPVVPEGTRTEGIDIIVKVRNQ